MRTNIYGIYKTAFFLKIEAGKNMACYYGALIIMAAVFSCYAALVSCIPLFGCVPGILPASKKILKKFLLLFSYRAASVPRPTKFGRVGSVISVNLK